jgi:hypothetical protein
MRDPKRSPFDRDNTAGAATKAAPKVVLMKEVCDFESKYDVLDTRYACTARSRGVKAGYSKSVFNDLIASAGSSDIHRTQSRYSQPYRTQLP